MGLQDVSGHSVFYKSEAGEIFHTYSTSASTAFSISHRRAGTRMDRITPWPTGCGLTTSTVQVAWSRRTDDIIIQAVLALFTSEVEQHDARQ